MSDFCFVDDACHATETIGDGPLDVVSVCNILKVGWRAAINIDPFEYLMISVSQQPLGMQSQAHTR